MIPVMEEYKYHEGEYLKRIMKRLEYDLVAILPDLDKQNDIDKATKVRKFGDYHFPIKNKKLYEWEYKNRMKVPKPPNEEKPGIKEHVEEAVDEELGEVYHLIRSLKRQIQTDELQRQARARLVDQARREEQRARDVRGETFRNSQFNGRRKKNVSDDIVETDYKVHNLSKDFYCGKVNSSYNSNNTNNYYNSNNTNNYYNSYNSNNTNNYYNSNNTCNRENNYHT